MNKIYFLYLYLSKIKLHTSNAFANLSFIIETQRREEEAWIRTSSDGTEHEPISTFKHLDENTALIWTLQYNLTEFNEHLTSMSR